MLKNKITYLLILNILLLILFLKKAFINLDTKISYGLFIILTLLITYIWKSVKNNNESNIKTVWSEVFKRFKKNKSANFGLIILIIMVYISILAPFIAPHDPLEIDWGLIASKPTGANLLGTDDLGRDVLSRTIYGTRVALGIGMLTVTLNGLLGTFFGIISGYYGGIIDNAIMRGLEIFNSIPFILLAISIMAALGTGIIKLIFIVSLAGIMSYARIIRGSVLLVKEEDYVSASRIMGIPNYLIILRHILPNCIAPIIVISSLRVGETILTIAGLSFLGLGIQPPTASLGFMLSIGQQYLSENIYMSVAPGTTILLIVLATNLLGDGFRDALDSKLSN